MNFRFLIIISVLLIGNIEPIYPVSPKKSARPEQMLGLAFTLASFGNDIAALGIMLNQGNKEAAIGALERVEMQMTTVEAQLKDVVKQEHQVMLEQQMPEIRRDLTKIRHLLRENDLAEARTTYGGLLDKQSELAGALLDQAKESFDDRSTAQTWVDWALDWWYAEQKKEK